MLQLRDAIAPLPQQSSGETRSRKYSCARLRTVWDCASECKRSHFRWLSCASRVDFDVSVIENRGGLPCPFFAHHATTFLHDREIADRDADAAIGLRPSPGKLDDGWKN